MTSWFTFVDTEYENKVYEMLDRLFKAFLKKYKYFYFVIEADRGSPLHISYYDDKTKRHLLFESIVAQSIKPIKKSIYEGGFPWVIIFTKNPTQAHALKNEVESFLRKEKEKYRPDFLDEWRNKRTLEFSSVRRYVDGDLAIDAQEEDAEIVEKIVAEFKEIPFKREEKK